MGMAVLGNNIGELRGTVKDDNTITKATISVEAATASTNEAEYNLGIYNEGNFTIENADITVNGAGSIGIYNIAKNNNTATNGVTLEGNNTITVSDGAAGIYSVGGKVDAVYNADNPADIQESKLTITSTNNGLGVYALDGAQIKIQGDANTNNRNSIRVENGKVGIASVGKDSNGKVSDIVLENTDIYYSGDGYALYTDDPADGKGSTISSLKGSTLTLGGKAFGMKLDLQETGNNQPIKLSSDFKITVESGDVTVFNLVNKTGGNYNIQELMSNIQEGIKNATKITDDQGNVTDEGFDIESIDYDKNKPGADLYKVAIVDGGKLIIDKDISQATAEKIKDDSGNEIKTYDFFYFKRFLGQRLDISVGNYDKNTGTLLNGVQVDGTMSGEHADKYFAGQIVGLEANSSEFATDNTGAKITVDTGSKIIANRLNDSAEDNKNTGAIGLYGNFGTIILNSGSTVEVEKKAVQDVVNKWDDINKTEDQGYVEDSLTEDKVYNEGVGIFAVNGSKVDINGKTAENANDAAKVDVYGDKAIGVYGLTYREKIENGETVICGDEFGDKAQGQGEITINNAGTIDVSKYDETTESKGTVGIYAENNNTKTADGKATITNSGTIKVGGVFVNNSATEEKDKYTSSIGIYGQGAVINNTNGEITVGSATQEIMTGTDANATEVRIGSVGIYADNSQITGDNLGTITLGKYSTGIVVENGGKITANGTLKLESLGTATDPVITTERMGVLYNGVSQTNDNAVAFNIDMSGVEGGKALVISNGTVDFNGDAKSDDKFISINGKNSRGIRVLDNGTVNVGAGVNINLNDYTGTTAMTAQEGSIGILAMDDGGTINNGGTINVNSENGIGIYVTNVDSKTGNKVTQIGEIKLNSTNSVGVFAEGTGAIQLEGENTTNSINFNGDTVHAIGIYGKETDITLNGITLNNKNDKDEAQGTANILVYADNNTNVKNNGTITVSDNLAAGAVDNNAKERTIGIYLRDGSTYNTTKDGTEVNGTIVAEQGAIGLYADKGKITADGNKIENIVNLENEKITVNSKGVNTIGVVLRNGILVKGDNTEDTNQNTVNISGTNITLTNTVTGTYTQSGNTNKALGIYADGTGVNIAKDKETLLNHDGGKNGEYGSNGTGIYLVNGAEASGEGTLKITGKGILIDKKPAMSVGLFYAGAVVNDNNTPDNTNDDYIEIEAAGNTNDINLDIEKDNTVGIFAGVDDFQNEGDITATSTDGLIAGIYSEDKKVTQMGNVNLTGQTVGVITKSGDIELGTDSIITLNGSSDTKSKNAVGLYTNSGNITVNANGNIAVNGKYDAGIVYDGTAVTDPDNTTFQKVTNKGVIAVNGDSGTGVYLSGNAVFDGQGGTINVHKDTSHTHTSTEVGIGIYLKDGAKLGNGTGTLNLGDGDIGVYAQGSNVDGSEFETKNAERGIINISDSTHAIAIAATSKMGQDGNGPLPDKKLTVSNLDLTIGKDSVGIYALDTGVSIDKVTINANADGDTTGDDATYSTGIYLKNCEDTSDTHNHTPYEITDSKINIKKGFGIYVDNKISHTAELNLENTVIDIDSYTEEAVNGKETESGLGIYLQNGAKLLSSVKNTYDVKDGIGVYADENAVAAIGGVYDEKAANKFTKSVDDNKDNILLKGYSIGAFTQGGEIYIGNAGVTFDEGDYTLNGTKVISGSLAFANDGDITNYADINTTSIDKDKVKDFVGLAAVNSDAEVHTITNTGNINISGSNSVGIAAIGTGIGKNIITNSGTITVDGVEKNMAAGIYSTTASIDNTGNIAAGNYSVGIFYNGSGHSVSSVDNINVTDDTGNITLTGTAGIGAYLSGTATKVELSNITSDKDYNLGAHITGLTGVNNNEKLNVNLGTVKLADNSIGLYINATTNDQGEIITESNLTINNGIIIVENAVDRTGTDNKVTKGNAIGIMVENSDVTLGENVSVTTGIGGTALYNVGGTVSLNKLGQLKVVGSPDKANDGAIVYVKGGQVNLTGGGTETIAANGHFGLVMTDGGIINGAGANHKININVSNGGTGLAVGKDSKYENLTMGDINVTGGAMGAVNEGRHSVGVYYFDREDITSKNNADAYNITQTGSKTVGMVLDNTYGTIEREIILTDKAESSIGMVVRNNGTNMTTIEGNISVEGAGVPNADSTQEIAGNVGLGVRESDITTNGAITVAETSGEEGSFYPIGVYVTSKDETKEGANGEIEITKRAHKYDYIGKGDLTVGTYGTGILGENYNIDYTGNIKAADSSIGIFAQSTVKDDKITIKLDGNLNLLSDGNNRATNKAIGIYGMNSDIIVTAKAQGSYVGTDGAGNSYSHGDIGIVNVGSGNINYTGNMTLGANGAIGIYKEKGSGKITVDTGKWTIGEKSYGIVARNPISSSDDQYRKEQIEIINNAHMDLGTSAVGIYSYGVNNIINHGDINVGATINGAHSAGIYMINDRTIPNADGNIWATGENNGTITVDSTSSVGVWALGYAKFTNNSIINVSNGATGVSAISGAVITNEGTINVYGYDENTPVTENMSIGMMASGAQTVDGKTYHSTIINNGRINVYDGGGMYIDDGAVFENNGKAEDGEGIYVTNGYGIGGTGDFTNSGYIYVENPETGEEINSKEDSTDTKPDTPEIAEDSKIMSISDGILTLGSKFKDSNGILEYDGKVNTDGMVVDITAGNQLGIRAPEIVGKIRLDSNFASTGNGYSYIRENFFPNGSDITVMTSPLFKPTVSENDLIINKAAYRDIVNDSQFNKLYDGLDENIKNGVDSSVLQKLNEYLDQFGDTPEFYREASRTMSEFKGNIYANVQSRMQDINRSFDNSFDEMEQSYNLSKDTDKFSVIYTNGDYKNSKAGIIDYDYNIAGLMYMKEFEGLEYGNKYGYTFGFTGSKFEFEDAAGSEEKVYSLRAGAHNVKDFGNGLDLLSKVEAGYNYHDTERKMAIPDVYENDADFNSYHVSLENKFRKTLYEDYENEFGTYLGLDLEYGRFDDIKEDGVARLKVKGNDYFISKLETGFAGTGRKYLGNDWTMKLTGDVGYSYDFGKNYGENKAKLRDASEGYYSLMSEVESRGAVSGKIGVGFEKLNHLGVTLEGEVAKDFRRDEEYWKVGLRFNYKFNKEDAVTTIRNTFNLLGNHFAFDKDEVSSRDKKIISEGSRLIDKHNVKGTIIIEGHTDSFGTEKYNQNLSEKRAANVETEFRKNIQKAENIQYDTKGYGESRPIESNDTPEGRAANRRTDVKFIDKR